MPAHAFTTRARTFDSMNVSCGCCTIKFTPTPPYNKTDSYASVVQQQSALSMVRHIQAFEYVPCTCNRTRDMYLFLKKHRMYLQNRAWLWCFRRMHYIACVKLKVFLTQLEDLKQKPGTYKCLCKLASHQVCNERYKQLFGALLVEYKKADGVQAELLNMLSTRMCQDVAAEVISYMFHPDQLDMQQLYQRGNCL